MNEMYEARVYEMLWMVARALVERPDDLKVGQSSNAAATVFTLEAHPSDVGKLIGANGRTARALRVIVGASGAKMKRSLSVHIVQRDVTVAPEAQ